MNKEQAEELRLRILERRNYFKQLDHPLSYSKTQLHSGMQGRVVRQEDRRFMRDVKKGKGMANKNLKTIDKYLSDLNAYNNMPQQPIDEGAMGTMSAPAAPAVPTISLTPKLQMRRKVRRGMGGY